MELTALRKVGRDSAGVNGRDIWEATRAIFVRVLTVHTMTMFANNESADEVWEISLVSNLSKYSFNEA
jgi:hypothetical protein